MKERIRLLKQERMNLGKELHDMLETASKEGRSINAEEKSRWTRLSDDVDAKGEEVRRLEKLDEIDADIRSFVPNEHKASHDGDEVARRNAESNSSVMKWLRGGQLSTDEQRSIHGQVGRTEFGETGLTFDMRQTRAQTTAGQVGAATGTAGGDIVAPTFYNELVAAMKWYGGMRNCGATILTTDTGATLQMPNVNDTGNAGRMLGENVQVTETDFTFGQQVLNAYIFSSDSVLVPLSLMQDSAFPLDSWIGKQLGTRIGRQQNIQFTVGTGTSAPIGIISGVSGKSATTGYTQPASSGATVHYSDFVNLEHGVDPAYRGAAKFMMNDAVFAQVKTLVDGNGRPLWQPFAGSGLRDGFVDTILGYPVVLNQDFPAPTNGGVGAAFGDFSNYYIRDVKDVTILRLTERYADYFQVGFIAFARADGILLDAGTHPVQTLKLTT